MNTKLHMVNHAVLRLGVVLDWTEHVEELGRLLAHCCDVTTSL